MTRFLVGLLLAALTLGGNDLAAQRPAQRPPAPATGPAFICEDMKPSTNASISSTVVGPCAASGFAAASFAL